MKIFDCHIHCSERGDDVLLFYARKRGLEYNLNELLSKMQTNEISAGLLLSPPLQTGGIVSNEQIVELCQRSQGKLFPVITLEPSHDSVAGAIELAQKNKAYAKAFKILLGYYPVYPDATVFSPLFDYAEGAQMPVLFHTGDTATSSGSLKHSHPMTIDPLANSRPNLKIVLCHFGNPWLQDAAELLYKHPNVYADISGLFVAGARYSERYLKFLSKSLSEAIYYIGSVDKVIFGSDYPIEDQSDALLLARSLSLEKEEIDKILGLNAAQLFSFPVP
jgi:uncharacterized protein